MTKLNLMVVGMPKTGYTNLQHNVAPQIEYGPLKPVVCDVRQLDTYVDDSECDEIISDFVTDYLSIGEIMPVLERWVKKLRKNGTITINCTDMRLLSKSMVYGAINTGDANAILFSPNPPHKKSALRLNDVLEILGSFGLKIEQKRFERYEISVTARRV